MRLLSAYNDANWTPRPVPASSPVAATFRKYAKSPRDVAAVPVLDVLHAQDGASRPADNTFSGVATIHTGFYDAWSRLYPSALSAIRAALTGPYSGKVKKILATGHSLGSAIAMVDAMALRSDLGEGIRIENIVYGSPRVFNPVGARLFEEVAGNDQADIYFVSLFAYRSSGYL